MQLALLRHLKGVGQIRTWMPQAASTFWPDPEINENRWKSIKIYVLASVDNGQASPHPPKSSNLPELNNTMKIHMYHMWYEDMMLWRWTWYGSGGCVYFAYCETHRAWDTFCFTCCLRKKRDTAIYIYTRNVHKVTYFQNILYVNTYRYFIAIVYGICYLPMCGFC